ncbi:unnamed protein product [Protopolystoma xenopodis]|uniref:Uncharacterized protein n=1 Tax=Protopolystoma xenopodis TaxID=117903 RepID=A0A3S5CMU2_9PLAT|nr:unnamed protein product [Protopolystoma xenopodis]
MTTTMADDFELVKFTEPCFPNSCSHRGKNGLQFRAGINWSYQHPQRESNRDCAEWELDTLTTRPHCHECVWLTKSHHNLRACTISKVTGVLHELCHVPAVVKSTLDTAFAEQPRLHESLLPIGQVSIELAKTASRRCLA